MFDYYGRKKVAQMQSRKVIEKYADEYAKLTHRLSFSEAGLKELENELKDKCQNELMVIRKNFKNEAEPGLSNNKLEYAQAKKDKYSKLTAQEKQTMLIEQQLKIQELEAQLEIYGAGGMLETLKELSTQDEQLFNIVKGKCMAKADANTKNIISGMNYIDLVEADMDAQRKDLAIIDMRWDTPIFDVSMEGKSLEQLIFNKENDMSDYFFSNSNAEVVE